MTDFDTVREAVEYATTARGDFTEALAALARIEAENERLRQRIHDMESDRDVFDLRAENERLRRIEEAAREYLHSRTTNEEQRRLHALRTALEEEDRG